MAAVYQKARPSAPILPRPVTRKVRSTWCGEVTEVVREVVGDKVREMVRGAVGEVVNGVVAYHW